MPHFGGEVVRLARHIAQCLPKNLLGLPVTIPACMQYKIVLWAKAGMQSSRRADQGAVSIRLRPR